VLTGKVLTESNAPAPESVTVALRCGNKQEVAEAHSDNTGFFSISLQVVDEISTTYLEQKTKNVVCASDFVTCELAASLAGYRSDPLPLTRPGAIGVVDVGTILLHPTMQQKDQPYMVSVSSLAATEKAKDAFQKGEEQKKRGKWAAAIESFRKAIAVYPRYSLAWLELGRVQASQNNFVEARQSFHESVAQDSKLVDGYVELARLAAEQGQWQELATTTDHLLQMHPNEPEFWFLNSVANFNLANTKQAEVSILRGMRLDSRHRLTQMEYLYGLILARKQDYSSAADHVASYLKLAPQAKDAPEAQKRLVELQKSAQASVK